MKNYALALLLLLSLNSFSQTNFNTENLIVTPQELGLKSYEKDSLANALVIYEEGNSFIDRSNGNLITEIKRKIKIFNTDGFKHATVVVPLYKSGGSKEKIKNLKGVTVNISGKSDLNKNNIFEEKYSDKVVLSKFTFPNLKEGSVISYSYTIESPFIHKYHPWEFQSTIPKLKSTYHTSIPGNYEYNIRLVGELKLFSENSKIKENCFGNSVTSASCRNTTYVMKDIPSFIEEDYMTASENYLSKLDYELKTIRYFDGRVDNKTKSWKNADRELKMDVFKNQLFKSGSIKNDLQNIDLSASSALEKAKSIYEYVQNNYIWNGKHRLFNSSVKNLTKEKTGNATEINILLLNLMHAAKIPVKAVLLSTRANGIPTKLYPVIGDFNYLIVKAEIDGKEYLLDGTDKYLFFGELPFKCLNYFGRQLPEKGASRWLDIQPMGNSNLQDSATLVFNEEENIFDVTLNEITTGYKSLYKRKRYFQNPTQYKEDINYNNPNLEYVDHKLISGKKNESKFEEEIKFTTGFDNINGRLYVNPFTSVIFETNPLKLQQRTYPVEFGYKDTYVYKARLIFDESYTVAEVPSDYSYTLPNNTGSLILKFIKKDNEVQVFLKFNFALETYPAPYYEFLKKYMAKVIDIQKNSIIIIEKKIN